MYRFLFAFLLTGWFAWAQLTPVWVAYGPGEGRVARVVVESADDCPALLVDGTAVRMQPRLPVPAGMKPACELAIGAAVKSASVGGKPLALGKRDPEKVVVYGDTGCRIKGDRIQECDDPTKWPLQRVSNRAAGEKPDLVIHVGDYLYREDKCPEDQKHLCGVGPAGDNWNTWAADFFTPASKLLAAAPWAFTRGNHEDCDRAWRGWFYYLDPRPWDGVCQTYSAPYLIGLGDLELLMLDSSAAKDKASAKQVGVFAKQLGSLHPTHAWLVDHHPFWGLKMTSDGTAMEQLATPLTQAWDEAKPEGISLVVSGHTHLFELFGFEGGRPPQLIAGDGGTNLSEALPTGLKGTDMHGAAIAAGTSRREFGYTLMTRKAGGWGLALKDPAGGSRETCDLEGLRASCESGR